MVSRMSPKAWAAGALVLAAVLAGCTNDDEDNGLPQPPEPTESDTTEPAVDPTSSEPTEEPTMSEQDQQIADARQAYEDFVEARDIAAQGGWEPGDEAADALGRTGGDYRPEIVQTSNIFTENNLEQSGRTNVISAEATDYEKGRVYFEVCLDLEDVMILMDGEEQENDPGGGRSVLDVEMQLHEDFWLVWDVEPLEGQTC